MQSGSHILAGVAALAAMVACAPQAYAEDWSITGFLRQTFEAETNRRLDSNTGGAVYGSTTGVNVTVNRETKRTLTSVRASLDGVLFTGSADADGLDRLQPNLDVSHTYRGKTTTLTANANISRQSVSETQFEDSGIVDVNADQITGAYNIGLDWRADQRTTVNFGTTGRIVDFSRSIGSLTPTRTFGVTGRVSRQVTATTNFSVNSGFRFTESDNAQNSSSQIVDLGVGITHDRTSRHKLGANAGVSAVFSDDNLGPSDTSFGFNGGATLDYTGKTVTGSVGVSQAVDASNTGEVSAFSRFTGTLAYSINNLQSVNFNAALTRRSDVDGGGDVRHFFSAGPTFSYRLTQDASISLGYSFRLDDDEDADIETSHRVFLTLSRNFTLLP